MPTIKSDLTSKNYPQRGMREIEVPDESEEMYDYSQDQGPPPNSQELDINAINARLASRGLPPLDNVGMKALETRKTMQTESVKEFENKVAEARRARSNGRERLSESAKRRIDMLCGLFKNTKEVDVGGNIFVIRVLKGKEIREALIAASEFDGTISLPFETRKNLLGRSLVQIAGTDVEMFLGDDSIEARMEFLEELDEPVLSKIYQGYAALVDETNAKYTVKNEADAKEVAADLKK